jgi:DUF1680 family protein
MGHELYCAGHLIQGAIAMDRAAGEPKLLEVAIRFADLIDDVFRGGEQTGTDGHPEIETALVELYRHTGERRYLELAGTLVDRRGAGQFDGGRFELPYYQDDEPVRAQRSIRGHAVRALYLAAGVTDLYAETGERALIDVMRAQWDDLASAKTYLTGGVGSRHRDESIGDAYELPPDRAYCETCAAIASIMWNWRMLLVSGESRHGDAIERALYNGFLSGLSLDGRSFFYSNPLQSRTGELRHAWNPVACCPPNIMRLLASLDQYVATQSPDGIQLHQYVPGTIRSGGCELRVETGYPWTGTVEIEIAATGDEPWTLAVRVPDWARHATLDGAPVAAGGYAELRRSWRAGDTVTLALDVAPRLTAANPRIDAVRGCLAVERGPVVYCLEQIDQPAGADLADVALCGDETLEDAGPIEALGGIPAVRAAGEIRGLDGWPGTGYRDAGEVDGPVPTSPAELVAVPYFAWANRGPAPMRVWVPTP